jgi:hypothetical protein
MPTYKVRFEKTTTSYAEIEVIAKDEKTAQSLALEQEDDGDVDDWDEDSVEVEIESTEKISDDPQADKLKTPAEISAEFEAAGQLRMEVVLI